MVRRFGVVLVLAASALWLGGCATSDPAGGDPPGGEPPGDAAGAEQSSLVGQAAPDFALMDLDGKEVTLASLKGKPVILDFWATWCGPCKMIIPALQKLHEEYDGKITIVGMAVDDEAAVKAFVKENNMTYLQLITPRDTAWAYGVSGIPHMFFIDADGTVKDDHVGASSDPYPALKASIDALL